MKIEKLIEVLKNLKDDGYEEVKIKIEQGSAVIESDIEITEQRLEGQVNLWATIES